MKSKNDALLDWRRQVAASSSAPNINNNKNNKTKTIDPMNKVHFAEIDESIRNGADDDNDDDLDYDLDYEYPPSNSSYYNYNEGGSSIGRDRSTSALGGSSSLTPLRKQNNHLHPFQNGVNSSNIMNNNNNNSINSRHNVSPHSNNNNNHTNNNISHGTGGLLPKVS